MLGRIPPLIRGASIVLAAVATRHEPWTSNSQKETTLNSLPHVLIYDIYNKVHTDR